MEDHEQTLTPAQIEVGLRQRIKDLKTLLAAEREKVRLLREVVQDMKDLWDGDGDSGFPLYDAAKAALAGPQSERTEKTS